MMSSVFLLVSCPHHHLVVVCYAFDVDAANLLEADTALTLTLMTDLY